MTKKKRIMSLVLIGVLLVSLLVGTFLTVFALEASRSTENKYVAEDGDGNKFESGNVYELPSRLVFSGNSLNSGVNGNGNSLTFSVTIEPIYATDKSISWNLYFAEKHGWASGKNVVDYVTLSTDGFNATISCIKPFGEQIILVARPNSNLSISASCTMDFRKKVIDVESPLLEPLFGEITLPTLEISANSTQNMYDLFFGSLKWIESDGTLPVEYQENGLPNGVTLPEYKEGAINGKMWAMPRCADNMQATFGKELAALFGVSNNTFFDELWVLSPKAFFEKYLYLNEYPDRAANFIEFLKKYDDGLGFLRMVVGGTIDNFGERKNFDLKRHITFTDLERAVSVITPNVNHVEYDGYVTSEAEA